MRSCVVEEYWELTGYEAAQPYHHRGICGHTRSRAEAPGALWLPGTAELDTVGLAAASVFWGLQFWLLKGVPCWVLTSFFRSGFLFFKEFNQRWTRLHLKWYGSVITKHRWDSTRVVNCWCVWHVEPIPMCWLQQETGVMSSSTACLSWGCVASVLVPACQEPKALPGTWISTKKDRRWATAQRICHNILRPLTIPRHGVSWYAALSSHTRLQLVVQRWRVTQANGENEFIEMEVLKWW